METFSENPGIFPESRARTSDPGEALALLRGLAKRTSRSLAETLTMHEEQALNLLLFLGATVARVPLGFSVAAPPPAAPAASGRAGPGAAALPASTRRRAEPWMARDAASILATVRAVRFAVAAGQHELAMKECINLGALTTRLFVRPHEYAASIGAKRLTSQVERTGGLRAEQRAARARAAARFHEIRPNCTSDHQAFCEVAQELGVSEITVRRAVKPARTTGPRPPP